MTTKSKPEPYALEKLSKATSKLKQRGDLRRRIHDAAEGFMVIGPSDLTPLQAGAWKRIVAQLTAKPAASGVVADDPRVMTNLLDMPDEQLRRLEADILLLYEDVKSYFA